MSHSYIAYIDESGDDGLNTRFRQPSGDGGASHWLVLGATVWRISRDLDMVRCAKQIASQLPTRKQVKPLHFADLDHSQRVMAINTLTSAQKFRVCAVCAYKPIIPAGTYTEKNQLYHYMARYLVERISWLCRDLRPQVPEGDGSVKIIFSRRGGMNYGDFRAYLGRLKQKDDPEIKIHWPVIDIQGVEALDHGTRFGLQLADLAVSGLRAAIEYDRYGNLEPRFATMLKPAVYCRNNNYLSYGAKLVPGNDAIQDYSQADVMAADLGPWLTIFG